MLAASTPAGGEKSCFKLRHPRVKSPAVFSTLFTSLFFSVSKIEGRPNVVSHSQQKAEQQNKQQKSAKVSTSGGNLAEGVALPFMTSQRADFQNVPLSGKVEMSE